MIPLLKPSVTQAEKDAVLAVLDSGWWGNGPICAQFEQELAARAGYAHAVTVNSATAALHLALLAAGIGPGDEVVVPALTFVSTALAVSYTGARPVFADVDPCTLCLDWADVAQVVTPATKAIIPVDFAGLSAGAQGVWNSWDLPIIEDAAHATLGRHYGDFVCYSFHPVKNLATGDGGAILLDDPTVASRLRALRWCGIDRDTWQRTGSRYSWDYAIQEIGYKVHWNDIDAAIGLAQLHRYDAMQADRRRLAANYLDAFRGQPDVELPATHPDHCWHLFVIRVRNEAARNDLLDYLASRGIAAGVHYKPLTYYPMFAGQPTPPVTDREWRRMVSLPIFVGMEPAQQAAVIDAVLDWLGAEAFAWTA